MLNLGGLGWMIYLIFLSFALIVQVPECDRMLSVIWDRTKELILAFGVFLGLTTGLNFFLEKKIEKRRTSKEYLIIAVLHFICLLIATIYASYEFYGRCG